MERGIKKKYPELYKVWSGLKQRCLNPNDKSYDDYGGRGISVCNEWHYDSIAFIHWSLTHGYAHGLSLDRIDTNSDYSPDNCRWTTWTEQARNKRMQKTNTSGVTGVYYEPERGKYRATIYANNRRVDLGRYDTLEEAAEARRQGEIVYWHKGDRQEMTA